TVVFEGLDVPYGESRCAVRIDGADRFPNDDASNFAVKRADPERVLFVHRGSDTRSPLYFGAALAAAGQASFVDQTAKYLSGEERARGARVVDSFVQLRNPVNRESGAAASKATVDIVVGK